MNDVSLTELGKQYKREFSDYPQYRFYLENIAMNKTHYMIEVVFRCINGEIKSHYVEASLYDNSSYFKYAWQRGSSKGGDITPTTKVSISDGNPEFSKKYPNILKSLSDINTWINTTEIIIPELEKSLFANTISYLNNNDITNQVKKVMLSVNANINTQHTELMAESKREKDSGNKKFNNSKKYYAKTFGITLKYEINGKEYNLEDFISIQNYVIEQKKSSFHTKYGTKSSGIGTCSICKTSDIEVYGYGTPYMYFSLDKPGFLINNLENSWKTYPICGNCAENMYISKKYVNQFLRYSGYGYKYYIIPKLIIHNEDVLEKLLRKFKQERERKINIEDKEEHIFNIISEFNNFFAVDIVFFTENDTTGALTIKRKVDDVYPSTFKKVFIDGVYNINSDPFYKMLNIVVKNIDYDNVSTIKKKTVKTPDDDKRKEFAVSQLINLYLNTHSKDFSIFDKLFNGIKIDIDDVYTKILNKTRVEYKTMLKEGKTYYDNIFKSMFISSYSITKYLNDLNLIQSKNNKNKVTYMSTNEEVVVEISNEDVSMQEYWKFNLSEFQEFIKNSMMFESNAQIGLFLLGVLVKVIAGKQFMSLGSTPIYKKLKNLKLSGRDAKSLYTDVESKLMQYTKSITNKNSDLETAIFNYFVSNISAIENMDVNEVSFYITSGLSYSTFQKQNFKESK